MAKSTKPRKKKAPQPQVETPTRRKVLGRGVWIGAGVVALGGAGLFSVRAVQATAAEQDLTRVGTGTPTIVQIHDPQCALCTALQRETRRALRRMPDGALTYLVANIRSQEGAAFANRHGQPHVTLLLMDGAGRVQEVINGVTDANDLETAFADHIARNNR